VSMNDLAQRVQRALGGPGGSLLQRAETLQYLLDQIPTGLVLAEAPNGRIVLFNDSAERILGHPLIPAHDLDDYRDYGAIHPDGAPFAPDEHPLARALAGHPTDGEIVAYRRGDGATIELSVNAAPLRDDEGRIVGAVTAFTDVTAGRAAEAREREELERIVAARTRSLMFRNLELDRLNAELRQLTEGLEETVRQRTAALVHQAQHDALTGLPNRRLLAERLERALATAARYGRSVGLLFLDLDGFKTVNDAYGHDAGDEVLVEVARRLSASLRGSDTLARLSGDEFVVLITEMHRWDDAREIGEALLERVAAPYLVKGCEVRLTVSIGVSIYPDDASDATTLQQRADAAMYLAKDGGKNQVRFHLHAGVHHLGHDGDDAHGDARH
jgi:diguanylate cyclase (GGDEF)-like protein/PAS domain S-box-containing protein